MKRVLIFASLLLVFLLLIFFFRNTNPSVKTQILTINGHQLTVEPADTDTLRTQGLSNRKNLAKDHGMLFTFSSPSYYHFWMKDMKFPLDFIWINNNSIIDITENVAQPKSIQETLPTFTSKFPFDKVIELNAGVIKSLNIKIGDRILL